MMERHDHINPWADKLQDIRLPEEVDSWKAMEIVLDREMPLRKWKDRRRWFLLIILLLLLIGVCNCPGRRFGHLGADRNEGTGHKGAGNPMSGKITMSGKSAMSEKTEISHKPDVLGKTTGSYKKAVSMKPVNKKHANKKQVSKKKTPHVGTDGETDTLNYPIQEHADTSAIAVKHTDTSTSIKKPALPRKLTPRQKADSTAAAERKAKADSVLEMKGWVAGIGLNQFFSVGQQQRSNYNSNGSTGGLSDYIPVPMVRYYFNRKLFVQIETQFNTPQYINRNLVGSKSAVDSTSTLGIRSQSVLLIKKLFYFNVPLSIHYSPVKNLFAGAGIQYSHLTNGVGAVQAKTLTGTGLDSTILSTKAQNFKGDSTYQKIKTNEFRLLFDLGYTYKRVIVGVRYNHALSKFLDVKIGSNQVSQSRNSSLQLYLRYILLDKRKKQLLPK